MRVKQDREWLYGWLRYKNRRNKKYLESVLKNYKYLQSVIYAELHDLAVGISKPWRPKVETLFRRDHDYQRTFRRTVEVLTGTDYWWVVEELNRMRLPIGKNGNLVWQNQNRKK